MLAGLMTVAGELLLLAVALGCQSWRGLLGAGAAPLTLFLSYGYEPVCFIVCMLNMRLTHCDIFIFHFVCFYSPIFALFVNNATLHTEKAKGRESEGLS